MPYIHKRWRQIDNTPNASPQKIEMEIQQPKTAKIYYTTCAAINRHNRIWQDDLCFKKGLETHNWSRRVNLLLFAICVVDAWFGFKGIERTSPDIIRDFVCKLSQEMIDNQLDGKTRSSMSKDDQNTDSDSGYEETSDESEKKTKKKQKCAEETSSNLQRQSECALPLQGNQQSIISKGTACSAQKNLLSLFCLRERLQRGIKVRLALSYNDWPDLLS